MNNTSIPDELVTLAQILRDEQNLRPWFISLSTLPQNVRLSRINKMAADMESGGENERIISAIRLLNQPRIFAALLNTIQT